MIHVPSRYHHYFRLSPSLLLLSLSPFTLALSFSLLNFPRSLPFRLVLIVPCLPSLSHYLLFASIHLTPLSVLFIRLLLIFPPIHILALPFSWRWPSPAPSSSPQCFINLDSRSPLTADVALQSLLTRSVSCSLPSARNTAPQRNAAGHTGMPRPQCAPWINLFFIAV